MGNIRQTCRYFGIPRSLFYVWKRAYEREAEARGAGRNHRALLDAGLREAEAMYRAMGAPDPADRLARELGS